MRKLILLLLLFCFASVGNAQTQYTAADFQALGVEDQLAEALAGLSDGTDIILDNGDYAQSYDESGNVHDVWGVDANGNTELLAPTGEDVEVTGGTNVTVTANAGDLTLTTAGDDIILISSDDTVLQTQGSGDIITLAGGGTDVDLTIADNLVTVADGTVLALGTGGATVTGDFNNLPSMTFTNSGGGAGDHGGIRFTNNTATTGDIYITSTAGSGSGDLFINASTSKSVVSAVNGTPEFEVDSGGPIVPTANDGFWSIQTGADTACSTTCTNGACVFGWDTSGTQADIVDCSGATADECLCAG